MTATKYIVELTEEEAVALAMISNSTHHGRSELTGPICAVSHALNKADPKLTHKQLVLWKRLHRPVFQFGMDTHD